MNQNFIITFLGEDLEGEELEVNNSPLKVRAYSKEEAVEMALGVKPDSWNGNTFTLAGGRIVGSCDPQK